MATPGFTPGPWEFKAASKATSGLDRDALLDVGIVASIDGKRHVIAEAFGRVDVSVYPDALANAHLIAAAPDLYSALKVITADYERLLRSDGMPDETEPASLRAAQQALAKAKGGPRA